jgi:hypothetical protein
LTNSEINLSAVCSISERPEHSRSAYGSTYGGANSLAMLRLGGSLGLYEMLHANGPMTSP